MSPTSQSFVWINDQRRSLAHVAPNQTLLRFLRDECGLSGTKEGCAEGDCGACTVTVYEPTTPSSGQPTLRALNACLLLVHALHGRRVYTVEGLSSRSGLTPRGGAEGGVGLGRDFGGQGHPAQEMMVERLGSQCGYCTPGVVMSLVEACYREDLTEAWQIDDQMCGNLCRCTGYRPIQEVAAALSGTRPEGPLLDRLTRGESEEDTLARQASTRVDFDAQSFARPTTLAALWEAWRASPTAELVAGGTDLGLRITKRFEHIPDLISIDQVSELRQMRDLDDGGWRIGAAVPLSDLEREAMTRAPIIARTLRFFGARQIKNRGTLGGNLCTASPIGDLAPTFLALNATLILASPRGERQLSIDEFFLGYRQTALMENEILIAVIIPPPQAGETIQRAFKVSKRQELDISSVSAAFSITLQPSPEGQATVTAARFAYGGMAATPARAKAAESALIGQSWDAHNVEQAIERLREDFTPIDDHRASAWYRAEVAGNLLRGFWLEASSGAPNQLGDRPAATVQLTHLSVDA